MLPLWLSGLLAAVVAAISYVYWVQSYWTRKGVRQEKPKFLLGNLWDLVLKRRTIGDVVGGIYRKYDTQPYVGLYKMLRPVLLVRDPELVREVLVKNFACFQNNETLYPAGQDEVFSDNPFVAEFGRWKELRTRLSQAFTPARVRLAFDDMAVSGEKLVDFLRASDQSKSFDTDRLSKRYSANTSVRVLFGIESNTLEPGKEPGPFYDMGHNIFNSSDILVNLRFIAFFTCPSLLHIIGHKLAGDETIAFFRKLIVDSVEYRQKEGVVRDDFVENAAKNIIVNGKVDPEALRQAASRVINSYVETFETASLTMSITFLLLAINPAEQDKLRAELRAAFPNKKLTSHDTLVALPYLDMVVKEALRLFPAGDLMRKSCTKATTLRGKDDQDGVKLRVGDAVYVCVDALHHDPAFYSHPDLFYPEHFSEEESAARPKCTYLPFSDGPRMCPGYKFGMLQIKVALASVLLSFEVAPGPEQVLPPQRDPGASFLGIKGGVWLRFKQL